MGGHVARMGEMKNAYNTLVANLKGRDHTEDIGVNGKITLEWILEKIWLKTVEWMQLAQDRTKRRTPVNTVMDLRVL